MYAAVKKISDHIYINYMFWRI